MSVLAQSCASTKTADQKNQDLIKKILQAPALTCLDTTLQLKLLMCIHVLKFEIKHLKIQFWYFFIVPKVCVCLFDWF